MKFEALHAYETMDLLRFCTAGSVDDGKSTLIGRLLFDTKNIFEDHWEAVEKASRRKGSEKVDLALLTDGLSAEREQGITIDVAYRYFATDKRKFIIADTPGHEQYTRNMLTGASNTQLAVILVDARKGVLEQTRRHAALIHLLRIPKIVFAVNKMDLVDWSEECWRKIQTDISTFLKQLGAPRPAVIPLCALEGDNVAHRSDKTPWYEGPTLLEYLETVEVQEEFRKGFLRYPVQWVLRPNSDYRGYAGRVAAGVLRAGEKIKVMSSGLESRVQAIDFFGEEKPEAFFPLSVCVRLENELDISRGDMLVDPAHPPAAAKIFESDLCWMGQEPLSCGQSFWLKHTTRWMKVSVTEILHRINIRTLEMEKTDQLKLNDLARVRLEAFKSLFLDEYDQCRRTGSFILVDEWNFSTCATGMVRHIPA